MKFLVLSLAIFALTATVKAQQTRIIPCNFFSSDGFYNCQINDVAVIDDNNQNFRFTGQHQPFMSDSSVTRILISSARIPFVINQLFTTFPNVRVYDNNNGGLNRVQTESFVNSKNMLILSIRKTPSLRQIDQEAFRNAPNLVSLTLDSNGIETIHPRAFVGIERLVSLILSENQIHQLDSNVFSPLRQLQFVDIGSNRLETLSGSLFSNNPAVSTMIISNNQINAIERTFLENLLNLSTLIALENRCINGQWFNVAANIIRTALSTCFANFENQPQPEGELRRFVLELRGPLSLRFENGTEIVRV